MNGNRIKCDGSNNPDAERIFSEHALGKRSRPFSRRECNPQETLRKGVCAYCGRSWSAGKDGQILCLNPESPYAYHIVPADLASPEQGPNPEQLQG